MQGLSYRLNLGMNYHKRMNRNISQEHQRGFSCPVGRTEACGNIPRGHAHKRTSFPGVYLLLTERGKNSDYLCACLINLFLIASRAGVSLRLFGRLGRYRQFEE